MFSSAATSLRTNPPISQEEKNSPKRKDFQIFSVIKVWGTHWCSLIENRKK